MQQIKIFLYDTFPIFKSFVRYNRLREKFPAASFSGTRPNLSEAGFDLLNKLLTYDPEKVKCILTMRLLLCHLFYHLSELDSFVQRISADAALQHQWFHEVPLPKSKDFMPTFPALNELDR